MKPSRPDAEARSEGSTSRTLLGLVRGNDPQAWIRLVTLYAPLVAWWCRKGHVEQQDIADLLQEVFAAVSANLPKFRKERTGDTFRGWLGTITRNKICDYHRHRGEFPDSAGGTQAWRNLAEVADLTGDAADALEDETPLFNQLVCRGLEAIRNEFQDRTWLAFWEVVVEGRSTAEVASALAMQPGAVRVAKSRVLQRLRRELGELEF